MVKEIFKRILGYNDNYYISNYGRVYSVVDCDFVTPYRMNNGRLAVELKWNDRKYRYSIDKLVFNVFFIFPFETIGETILDIEHMDGDLTNNCVWNLNPITAYDYEKRARTYKEKSKRLKENDRMMERILERGKRIAENALERQKKKSKETV